MTLLGIKYVKDGWEKIINPTDAAKKTIQNIEKTNIAKAGKLNEGYTDAIDDLTNMQKVLEKEINKNSSKTVAGKIKKIEVKNPLLPNEGKVGTHGELQKLRIKGDNLTPHHTPQDAYMRQFGVKKSEGISIMVEQPHPGTGGRHRKTITYGSSPNLEKKPRDELAKDIMDLRNIYKEDGVYTPKIQESLQEIIEQNKNKFPEIFKKE